jgi:short-subunit dehydrogenase
MAAPDPRDTLAVVTGASAGIGRVFAERLAQRGFGLVLIGRDGDRIGKVASDLSRDYRVAASTIVADLATEADIDRVAGELAAGPEVSVLVNNAGFGTKGRLHQIDAEPQARMLRLHIMAPMRLTHAVLPRMVKRGAGWIINVASVAGFSYSVGNTNYCASKAWLIRFSESLETELVGTGVVVQALCPGFVRTEFHARGEMDMSMVPNWLWFQPEPVVDASLRAAERGRPVVVIPGPHYQLIARMMQMTPRWLMRTGRDLLRRGGDSEDGPKSEDGR